MSNEYEQYGPSRVLRLLQDYGRPLADISSVEQTTKTQALALKRLKAQLGETSLSTAREQIGGGLRHGANRHRLKFIDIAGHDVQPNQEPDAVSTRVSTMRRRWLR